MLYAGERSEFWIDQSGTRYGSTAGLGIKTPVTPHSSVKVECLYANFGQFSYYCGAVRNDVDYVARIVRVGLNFGFLN